MRPNRITSVSTARILVKGFPHAFRNPIGMLSSLRAFYEAALDRAFIISLVLIVVNKPISF